jgi:two-component sensor histidine kinase
MSISFVHERLYRTAELSTLQLDEYLADLVAAIAMAVGRGQVVPRIKLDLQSLVTNLDVAVPLGLIVNELATNAFKHGKPDGGSVSFELSMRADGERIELAARDDGVGIPGMTEEGSLRIEEAALSCPGRLGFTLLALMSAQLGGEGAYRRKAGWTEYLLEFGTGDKA